MKSNSNTWLKSILIISLLALTTNEFKAQIPDEFAEIIDKSFEVAGLIEKYRTVPDTISIDDTIRTSSQYFQMVVRTILNISGINTEQSPKGTWGMPGSLYPSVEPDSELYGKMIEKVEYFEFFNSINILYADGATLPTSFTLRGHELRFIDALYLASSILRSYAAFNYLPTTVDIKIASPKGLFTWEVPQGMEEFVGAIRNKENYSMEVNEYYQSSAMDFEMYRRAKKMINNQMDQMVAGFLIYYEVGNLYNQTPYGAFAAYDLFGYPINSYEAIRIMEGTSGTPHKPKEGLYPAAGFAYGEGGALFVEGHGWFNAEYHRPYGSDLHDNPFYYGDPDNPEPGSPLRIELLSDDPLLPNVKNVLFNSGQTISLKSFWINGTDINIIGADSIVQIALEGDFDAIVLTVKSFLGHLYFDTGDEEDALRFKYDALEDLMIATQNTNIKIYAGLSTLSDYVTINELNHPEWAQRYYEPQGSYEYNEFYVSPCITKYRNYLKRLINSLSVDYEINGIVLSFNSVVFDAWADDSCGIGWGASDTVKQAILSGFVNDLSSYADALNTSWDIFFITVPLVDMEGSIPQYEGTNIWRDAIPDSLDSSHIDGIILSINGLSWLTTNSALLVDEFISSYQQSTNIPIYITNYVSKEWQFPPEFYRGLARQYNAEGINGVFLVSNVSAEGEMGSAFVKQHLGKLKNIRFSEPPPQMEFPTSTNNPTVFTDVEAAVLGTPIYFNEGGADPGDGHAVDITFTSLTGSGNVTVQQTKQTPANLYNNVALDYTWDITEDAGITAFIAELTIHYQDFDLIGLTEGSLVAAYYDDALTDWSIFQDYTLDAPNNTITIHGLDHFTIFAIGEPEAFQASAIVDVMVFLEGPFNSGTMSTALLTSGAIPLDQPYSGAPWNYSGTESVTSIPPDVVDWVLVELRSSTTASSMVARRAAFLKSDGTIVDLDGGIPATIASSVKISGESEKQKSVLTVKDERKKIDKAKLQMESSRTVESHIPHNPSPNSVENSASPVKFSVAPGDYYIVIHHRNHLSIMSAAPHTINSASAPYDFTTSLSSAYTDGSAAMKDLGGGVYGMFSGDGNHSGIVTIADRNEAFLARDGVGYLDGDYNLSGIVTISDVNEAFFNRDASSQVPQ